MSYYKVKSTPDPEQFQITKFDDDLEVESSYTVSLHECDCPAGSRPTCRHRLMLPTFQAADKVDSDKFYHFESNRFVDLLSKETA